MVYSGLRGVLSQKEIICDYINFLETGNDESREVYYQFGSGDFKKILQDYSKESHYSNKEVTHGGHTYSDETIQCFVDAATIGSDKDLEDTLLISSMIYGVTSGGVVGAALGSIVNLVTPKDSIRFIVVGAFFGICIGAYYSFQEYSSYVGIDYFESEVNKCLDSSHIVEVSGVLAEES